jgi:hypothetical protein
MSTLTFRVRAGSSKEASIKVRFKQGDQFDFELSTGKKINRKHWSNTE